MKLVKYLGGSWVDETDEIYHLTVGKFYEIIDNDEGEYQLIDDNGVVVYVYNQSGKYFEDVEVMTVPLKTAVNSSTDNEIIQVTKYLVRDKEFDTREEAQEYLRKKAVLAGNNQVAEFIRKMNADLGVNMLPISTTLTLYQHIITNRKELAKILDY